MLPFTGLHSSSIYQIGFVNDEANRISRCQMESGFMPARCNKTILRPATKPSPKNLPQPQENLSGLPDPQRMFRLVSCTRRIRLLGWDA